MANWQVTAATLSCDVVGEEVTLMVYKDWSVRCTAYSKYGGADSSGLKGSRNSGCQGTDCRLATDYRKKLQAEEAKEGFQL